MESRFAVAHHAIVAGGLAGLVTTVLIWLVGGSGMLLLVEIPYDPQMSPEFIYRRTFWGGMWGLLFALPLLGRLSYRRRGILLGLIPSAVTLLVFNPLKDGLGVLGLDWGVFWPVLVILFNVLWGYMAGAWLDMAAAIGRSLRAGAA